MYDIWLYFSYCSEYFEETLNVGDKRDVTAERGKLFGRDTRRAEVTSKFPFGTVCDSWLELTPRYIRCEVENIFLRPSPGRFGNNIKDSRFEHGDFGACFIENLV